MNRRRAVSPEEQRLWRIAMRDADPLPGRSPHADEGSPAPPVPEPAAGSPAARPPQPPGVGPRQSLPFLDPANGPGLDRRTDSRFRRGQFEVQGRIDLHGMTQDQAHAALSSFILRSWHEQRRHLLVITGKGSGGQGSGVLRGAVPRWLNEAPLRPLVVAIHKAQPKHGGEGALYVLLKRRRAGP